MLLALSKAILENLSVRLSVCGTIDHIWSSVYLHCFHLENCKANKILVKHFVIIFFYYHGFENGSNPC